MKDAIMSIKAIKEYFDQSRVSTFVQKENGMSNEIGHLEQPGICHACEIWNVGKVMKDAPFRPKFSKAPHPYSRPLMKAAFGENQ